MAASLPSRNVALAATDSCATTIRCYLSHTIRPPDRLATDRIGQALVVTITVATAVTSVFLGLMAFRDPRTLVSGDAVVTAEQASVLLAARNVPLTGALVLLVALWAWRPLGYFLALAGVEQAFDTVVFASQHKVTQTVGPACFAGPLFGCAAWLLRGTRNGTL
jgi:hypothetical protein